jgi:hypothetical protein
MGSFLPHFPRSRRRRFAAWLALVALLLQAAVAGFHLPPAQAAGLLAHHAEAGCLSEGEGVPQPVAPGHAREHCPFCLTLQGGKLLPPAVCLVFPPVTVARHLGPPPADLTPPFSELPPAHRPRGPPLPA